MARSTFAVVTLLVATAIACAPAAHAAYCHGAPDPDAKPTTTPVYTGEPTFVRSVPNGKLYTAGPPGFEFSLIHVYGTPYEMGFAHGQLMQKEAQSMVSGVTAYMEEQVQQALKGWPTWLRDWVAEDGLEFALDLTYDLTVNYTGPYFYEELQGLAAGANVSYDAVRRIHMIGELTQGDCSMYGAWGTATASTGKTLQLRALDWDTDGPFKDHPAVIVYHPSGSDNGHAFANVGFVGWIGALSGQSSQHLAISEIGVSFPDDTFGKESRSGTPFTFLLRDILQFDADLNASITRIQDAHRTCDLILGVGDGKTQNSFRGFQYSASVANVVDDYDLIPVNDTWHPKIDNVVYYGMDWLCPNYSLVLSERLQKFHGNITVDNTVHEILPIVQTGDVHAVVYDLTDNLMTVSFMRPTNGTGAQMAYDRTFTTLDLDKLFAESPRA